MQINGKKKRVRGIYRKTLVHSHRARIVSETIIINFLLRTVGNGSFFLE